MDDTISRADAIALAEEVENKRLRGEIDLTYAPMIKGIKALPSAQQWIPCKERLPEMWVSVLVHVLDIPAGNNYTTLRNAVKGYRDALVRKAVSANEYARISGALRAVDEIDSRIEEMLKGVKA